MITEEIKKYFKHIMQENIWIRQFYGQDCHSSELRHALIAYPIETKLVLDKENDGNYWIIDTLFLLLTK